MEITPELKEKLSKLNEKYAALGEDFNAYLEGLLYADVTTYWDYIELDTLLSCILSWRYASLKHSEKFKHPPKAILLIA